MGEIYISSMLDTLICQSFYNPYITDILQQLIMGSTGNTFSFTINQKLKEKKISQSTLYLLNINEELLRFGAKKFSKKVKYKELFLFFVKNNMVPIGIYRNSGKPSSISTKKDKRYVYLCPGNETEVDIDHDQIYVLGGEDYVKKEMLLDPSKTKMNYSKLRNSQWIDKGNQMVMEIAQSTRKLVTETKNVDSVSAITEVVRKTMRSELAKLHDKIAEGV